MGIEILYSIMLRSLFFSTMGVDIGQWRAAIGRFGGGRDYRTAVSRNFLQKLLLHGEEVVRILLLLAGTEMNPGPTNQETLNWLKSVQSARQGAEEAWF